MAYQNIGTPRFYIDWNQYHLANGLVTGEGASNSSSDGKGSYIPVGGMNPTNQRYLTPIDDTELNANKFITYNGWAFDFMDATWVGVFGHNLGSLEVGTRTILEVINDASGTQLLNPIWVEEIVNTGSNFDINNDGV